MWTSNYFITVGHSYDSRGCGPACSDTLKHSTGPFLNTLRVSQASFFLVTVALPPVQHASAAVVIVRKKVKISRVNFLDITHFQETFKNINSKK